MTTMRSMKLLALICFATLGGTTGATAQEFHVERDFDVLRNANGWPLQNRYMVSLPLQPIVRDVANTYGSAARSKCVGDVFGPAEGDGVLDSVDLLCTWWTARANPARAGSMSVIKWDPATCMSIPTHITAGFPPGATTVSGTRFPLEPGEGYMVLVGAFAGATYSPQNHAVLEGDGDPAWQGKDIFYSATCPALAERKHFIHVPYDVAYTHVAEIACGLRNVDWRDADGDGLPDTCWADADADRRYDAGERITGLYDGRHSIVISRFVTRRRPDGVGEEFVESFIVMPSLGGRVSFAGVNFALEPSQSYVVTPTPGHVTTRWDPPLR